MKLSYVALAALRGAGSEIKKHIAEAAGVSPYTVYKWIRENDDQLTKAAILNILKKEFGLSEIQLLESEER